MSLNPFTARREKREVDLASKVAAGIEREKKYRRMHCQQDATADSETTATGASTPVGSVTGSAASDLALGAPVDADAASEADSKAPADHNGGEASDDDSSSEGTSGSSDSEE